jgi:hypothetical protein
MGATPAGIPPPHPASRPFTLPRSLAPGTRCGRLVLLSKAGVRANHAVWRCKCDCGRIVEASRSDKLRNGRAVSCGCYRREMWDAAHAERVERIAPVLAAREARKAKSIADRLTREQKEIIARTQREDIRERYGSIRFETRHTYLTRQMLQEGVPKTDLLWNLHFYTELVRDLICHYCRGLMGRYGHGLDRMDNTRPHEVSNVVPCCGFCNRLRSNKLTYEEMLLLSNGLAEIRFQRDLKEAL